MPVATRGGLVGAVLLTAVTACLSDPSGPFGHHLELGVSALSFEALGDTVRLAASEIGPHGTALSTPKATYVSLSPGVATVDSAGLVTSQGNGVTWITARVPNGDVDSVRVTVSQVPDTILASLDDTLSIVSIPYDAAISVHCEMRDRNGHPIPVAPAVAASAEGRWAGSSCDGIRARRSGVDTLVIQHGALATRLPVTIAVRPSVSTPLGTFLTVDSLPSGLRPWAPTLLRNASGALELYFTGYVPDSAHPGEFRGHLHRLISEDGQTFHYDGVALAHDDSLCTLNGSGIENVTIVPRAEGAGWRMFYSSGSFGCYGWQVFSAISTDRRIWTKEPGVRLSNGGSIPPDMPVTPPWPVGEGIVVEPLPIGGWRMLVGGYRHIQDYEDKFHIVEWRSTDQLTWTYVGPVFTTDDLPAAGQRSVYSPTVREFAPGLWRMIMTADNLRDPDGRSRIWSAVSTDEVHWQLEGELMGAVGTNLYYSSLVDDLLVFVRLDAGLPRRLASVRVDMP